MPITSTRTTAAPDFPVRRFTVEEYHRLGEVGVLTEADRVELLDGYIVPKVIHNPPHDTSVKLTDEVISRRLPPRWHTRVQSAITTDDSEPEPDVVIVRGDIRDFSARHPGPNDIVLLIEVADSSLQRDRQKRRTYARAGVKVYWIVNLVDRRVEVYTDPDVQEAGYRRRDVYSAEKSIPITSGEFDLGRAPVASLLP